MAPRRSVSDIQLWEADRSAEVVVPSGIRPFVSRFDIKDLLGVAGRKVSTSTLHLAMSCPVAVADPPLLTERRIIRVIYGDDSHEEFRIVKFTRRVSGDGDSALTLEPIWMDLGSVVGRRFIGGADPQVDIEWYLVGVTPAVALREIMARGAPAPFHAGVVAASLAGVEVSLHSIGNTPLEMLRALCEDITARTGKPAEWDVRWVGPAPAPSGAGGPPGGYVVDIVEEIGGVISHPIEGFTPDSRWNRRKLTRTIDATRYFSRVVPIGGPDGETGTIADATWQVTAIAADRVTLGDTPIYVSGMPHAPDLRLVRISDNTHVGVTGTETPDEVLVDTDLQGQWNVGDVVRFQSGDDRLVYLAIRSAEEAAGVKERRLRRSDIWPYPNLLADAGVTADLSVWSGGLPDGVTTGGPATGDIAVREDVVPQHVRAGTRSLGVMADTGHYVQSDAMAIAGAGYVSLWVNLRVLAGSVRLSLVAEDGTAYPRNEEALGAADIVLRGLSVGGLDPPAGNYRVRITALEDDTDFIVDSWTVTRSSTPFEYSPDMGPGGLWRAAGALLVREGGLQPDRLDGAWIDLSQLEAGTDAPRIGATVTVKDAGLDAARRIVELTRRLAAGVAQVAGKLGDRRPDLSEFLNPRRRRPGAPRVGPVPRPGGSGVAVAIDDVSTATGDDLVRVVTISGIRTTPDTASLRFRLDVPGGAALFASWVRWRAGITGGTVYTTSEDSEGVRSMVVTLDRNAAVRLESITFGAWLDASDADLLLPTTPPDASVTVPLGQAVAPREAVLLVNARPADSTAGVRGRLAVVPETG